MNNKERGRTPQGERGLQLTLLSIYLIFAIGSSILAGQEFKLGHNISGTGLSALAVVNFFAFARGLYRLK